MKSIPKQEEGHMDVSWLLKGIDPPHPSELLLEARAAATAYQTMVAWLSVCFEYSIRLQCAQLALRLYHGQPLPWPEQRETEAKLKKEADEKAAAAAKAKAAAEAKAAFEARRLAEAKEAAEAKAAAAAEAAAKAKAAAEAKAAAQVQATATAQAAEAAAKAESQMLLAKEARARVAVAVAEGTDSSQGGGHVQADDTATADTEPSAAADALPSPGSSAVEVAGSSSEVDAHATTEEASADHQESAAQHKQVEAVQDGSDRTPVVGEESSSGAAASDGTNEASDVSAHESNAGGAQLHSSDGNAADDNAADGNSAAVEEEASGTQQGTASDAAVTASSTEHGKEDAPTSVDHAAAGIDTEGTHSAASAQEASSASSIGSEGVDPVSCDNGTAEQPERAAADGGSEQKDAAPATTSAGSHVSTTGVDPVSCADGTAEQPEGAAADGGSEQKDAAPATTSAGSQVSTTSIGTEKEPSTAAFELQSTAAASGADAMTVQASNAASDAAPGAERSATSTASIPAAASSEASDPASVASAVSAASLASGASGHDEAADAAGKTVAAGNVSTGRATGSSSSLSLPDSHASNAVANDGKDQPAVAADTPEGAGPGAAGLAPDAADAMRPEDAGAELAAEDAAPVLLSAEDTASKGDVRVQGDTSVKLGDALEGHQEGRGSGAGQEDAHTTDSLPAADQQDHNEGVQPESVPAAAAESSADGTIVAGSEQQATAAAGQDAVPGAEESSAGVDSASAVDKGVIGSSSAGYSSSVGMDGSSIELAGPDDKSVKQSAADEGSATLDRGSSVTADSCSAAADEEAATIADNSTMAADSSTIAADNSTIAAVSGTIAADSSAVAADNSTIAAERSAIAADNSAIAAENSAIAADNSTIAAESSNMQAADEHVTAATSSAAADDSTSPADSSVADNSTIATDSDTALVDNSTVAGDSSAVLADNSTVAADSSSNAMGSEAIVTESSATAADSEAHGATSSTAAGDSSTTAASSIATGVEDGVSGHECTVADMSSHDDASSVAKPETSNSAVDHGSQQGTVEASASSSTAAVSSAAVDEGAVANSDVGLKEDGCEPGHGKNTLQTSVVGESDGALGNAASTVDDGTSDKQQALLKDDDANIAVGADNTSNEEAAAGVVGVGGLPVGLAKTGEGTDMTELAEGTDSTLLMGQQQAAAATEAQAIESQESTAAEVATEGGARALPLQSIEQTEQQDSTVNGNKQQDHDTANAAADLAPASPTVGQDPAEGQSLLVAAEVEEDRDDFVPVIVAAKQAEAEQTSEPLKVVDDVKPAASKAVNKAKQAAGSQHVSRSSSRSSKSNVGTTKQATGKASVSAASRLDASSDSSAVKAVKVPSGRLNASGNLAPHPPYGPPDTKLGKTAEQRLRRQLGDACWLMSQAASGTPKWPQHPTPWKEFRALLSQQGVRVTPGDWTDLKSHITLVKGVAHVMGMALAQMLAPDGPVDMLQPPSFTINNITADTAASEAEQSQQQDSNSTTALSAEGVSVSARLSAVSQQAEARLKARLSRAVHGAMQVHQATTFFHWLRFKEVMNNHKVQLAPADWEDLRPFLSVTLHSTISEQQPQPLTTYVHWQALRALFGPDGPTYRPPSSRPHSGNAQAANPAEMEMTPGTHLTTRLAAAVLQLTDEAAANGKRLGLVNWRSFMKLMAKQGSKLSMSDPLWWDLRPYTTTDELTTYVNVEALAAALRPDMPPMSSGSDNRSITPLPVRHAAGSAASMACIQRMAASLGPGTRKLYWQHHPEHRQQTQHMTWKDFNAWWQEEVGVSVTPEEWCDMYSTCVLLVTVGADQPPQLEPMTTYVDLSLLISLVGPNNPPGIPADNGMRPHVRTHKGDARAATALARLTARLLEAVLALQDPSAGSSDKDACSMKSPTAGHESGTADGHTQTAPGHTQTAGMCDLPTPVPDMPVPWKQMQSLLEGTGAVQTALGVQDWADLRMLDVLIPHPAYMLVNWPRLRSILRPDGPPAPASPSPRDADAAQARLHELLAYPLRLLTSSMTPEERATPYLHWVSFANLLSKAGIRLSPSGWADLIDYTSVTTSKAIDQQRPLPNTTYVHWSALIQDLLGDEPTERSTSPPGTARHSAGRARGLRLRSPDKQRSSSPYARSPKRGVAAWVPEGTRYPPSQPASAPAGLLSSMDGELHEQLVHLLARMQGRSMCPPTMREWELALAKLDRCVDDSYRSTRQQLSYAAAADGTALDSHGLGAGSPRAASTLPQLRAPQYAYGGHKGSKAAGSPRMAWGPSKATSQHGSPRFAGNSNGGDADSVCTEELLGKAPGAVLDAEAQYKRHVIAAVREQRARASAVMQQRMRNTLKPTTRVAGDYALPPNYAADTAAPSFPVPAGVVYQNYIHAKQENQRLLSDLKHAYNTESSQTLVFASRASSASGVACLIPPLVTGSRPASRA